MKTVRSLNRQAGEFNSRSAFAAFALFFGIAALLIAGFVRFENGGWLMIACFMLYVSVAITHLTVVILAWRWDHGMITTVMSLTTSVLLFTAFMLQFDAGDGPRFIVGWAFFDRDPENRNSMPPFLEGSSLTTNYAWFLPCLAGWITTLLVAKRSSIGQMIHKLVFG